MAEPSNWKRTNLRGKIHVKHGFPFKSEYFVQTGQLIVLTPGNFHEAGGFKHQTGKEKYYSATFPPDYLHKADDLIVAMTEQAEGLLGSMAFVPESGRYLHNQRIGKVSATSPEVVEEFLYHLFKTESVRAQIRNSATGSKVKHTSPERIYGVEVILPPPEEQRQIAAVLSALDLKIDINNRINAELELLAKTIYDYWFVQFDFPDANGRPYKTSGGKMVWNATLNRDIPEGWKSGSLWEIAKYTNGLAMQKYRPTGADFLPVIKIKEMSDGFSQSTEKAIPDLPDKQIVCDGDVLFSWSATLIVMIWSGGCGALNQHIFKVTSDRYPRSFYYFELQNYLNHFKMMADKRKTTMGHITLDHLKQSLICVPPMNVIKVLDEKINPILEQQLLLRKENLLITELRDWLLPMLMNGQVQVK